MKRILDKNLRGKICYPEYKDNSILKVTDKDYNISGLFADEGAFSENIAFDIFHAEPSKTCKNDAFRLGWRSMALIERTYAEKFEVRKLISDDGGAWADKTSKCIPQGSCFKNIVTYAVDTCMMVFLTDGSKCVFAHFNEYFTGEDKKETTLSAIKGLASSLGKDVCGICSYVNLTEKNAENFALELAAGFSKIKCFDRELPSGTHGGHLEVSVYDKSGVADIFGDLSEVCDGTCEKIELFDSFTNL